MYITFFWTEESKIFYKDKDRYNNNTYLYDKYVLFVCTYLSPDKAT